MLEDGYHNEKYDTNLLVTQLRPLTDVLNVDKTTVYVMDRKEKLDNIKLIIGAYLDFIVEKNYMTILFQLSNLNNTRENINSSIQIIGSMKTKIGQIKKKYMEKTFRIAIKKQRMNNLKFIHSFLADNLYKWRNKLKEVEKFRESKQYAKLFQGYTSIQLDITTWLTTSKTKNKKSIQNKFMSNLKSVDIFKDG